MLRVSMVAMVSMKITAAPLWLVIVAAIIVLAAATYGIVQSLQDDDNDVGPGIRVVVAKQDIPAGSIISAETLSVAEVPERLLVYGAWSETEPLIGQVTRVQIVAGEQITTDKLIALGPP